MEIVSEWQGKNPDDYRRQRDDEQERRTRASGYADIELSDIPDGDIVIAHPAGGMSKKEGKKKEGKKEKKEKKKMKQAKREETMRKKILDPKTVAIQNRELRGFLALIGFLTVFLIIIVLLFMSYPYRDDPQGKGTTFLLAPAVEVPQNSLFVGHSNPSTTSYCAAWASSLLYSGSYAVDGPLSPETLYIIERYSLPTPKQFSDVYDGQSSLVIVDHNQASQSPPYSYPPSSGALPVIAGIIDTHGIQEDFISSSYEHPIASDIRPWGSTATVIYYNLYERHSTPIKALARCLLSSIYSDTVGLEGPTTTDYDRTAASLLSPIASTSSRKQLTISLIKARTPPEDTPILDILNTDAKTYHLSWADGTYATVRWSIYEGADPNFILNRSEEFLKEMRNQKKANSLDFYFMSVVDQLKFFEEGVVEGISTLLLPSENEINAAKAVFQGETAREDTEMDVSPKMSRKQEFLPPLDYFFRGAQPFQWDPPSDEK